MRINTALILCAGFGKRLSPLTLEVPKPLLRLREITMLESCINTIIKLEAKKIFINTFHLGEQISEFIKSKSPLRFLSKLKSFFATKRILSNPFEKYNFIIELISSI